MILHTSNYFQATNVNSNKLNEIPSVSSIYKTEKLLYGPNINQGMCTRAITGMAKVIRQYVACRYVNDGMVAFCCR